MPAENQDTNLAELWNQIPVEEMNAYLQVGRAVTAMLQRGNSKVVYVPEAVARLALAGSSDYSELTIRTDPEQLAGVLGPVSIVEVVTGKSQLYTSVLPLEQIPKKGAFIGLKRPGVEITLSREDIRILKNSTGFSSNTVTIPDFVFAQTEFHTPQAIAFVNRLIVKQR